MHANLLITIVNKIFSTLYLFINYYKSVNIFVIYNSLHYKNFKNVKFIKKNNINTLKHMYVQN